MRMDDQDRSDASSGTEAGNSRRRDDVSSGAQPKARESAQKRTRSTRTKRTGKQRKGVLVNAARAIGSALGKVAAKTSRATELAKISNKSGASKKSRSLNATTRKGVAKKAGAVRRAATPKGGTTRKAGAAKKRKATR